jgi:CxxC motif-containing protein (DUF1111 family)
MRSFGAVLVLGLLGCGADESVPVAVLSGGLTTIDEASSHAFTLPAPNLDDEGMELHLAGDVAFEAQFVTAPAVINSGLGPLFNNNSCNACHLRNGRGVPTVGATALRSHMLVRVSKPDGEFDPIEGGVPHPEFGFQVQDHGNYGVAPEAKVEIEWQEIKGAYADGVEYSLRKPILTLRRPDGSVVENTQTSLRQAPPIFGLGLLEAVPDSVLVELADPDDKDGDGVSGRPNMVWSKSLSKSVIGRFGWKSNQPDVYQQSASAYVGDMGVGSPGYPDENGDIEIDAKIVESAAFYARSLAVPSSRLSSARGRTLFKQAGCDACHTPVLSTGSSEWEFLADQDFAPYTDLLLHDMGEGLADGRPDFEATGSEWRTSPLWGIGLTQTVAPGATYLHDGRARNIAEAILWHGGEGESSAEKFKKLNSADRAELVAFVNSL